VVIDSFLLLAGSGNLFIKVTPKSESLIFKMLIKLITWADFIDFNDNDRFWY